MIAVAYGAAPSIALTDLDGRARNVNEYIGQGRWTVVAIWASDCPICKAEIHQMAFFHDANKDKNARVLGVSVDGPRGAKKARAFIQEHGLDFPNLLAEPRQISEFGAGRFVGTPTFYVFSPDGELLAQQIGPVTQQDIEDFISSRPESKSKEQAPAEKRP